jgi:gamma-glutamyl hercynylcysteine S-oxide synthase
VSVLAASVSGAHLARWYARNRERSRALFDLLDPAVYYSRPIALRNPIVFYEGHLPAFTVIALLQRGLGRPGVDDRLEQLFARGIDPESEEAAVPRSGADTIWPSRDEVLAYGAEVDQVIEEVLTGWEAPPPDAPLSALRERDAVFTALEHEAMHQETLLYMWRRLPYQNKRRPAGVPYETTGAPPPHGTVRIPAGRATLGARPGDILFGWDNEFGECLDEVPAFDIDVHSVTNADYLGFVADGGYDRQDLWSDDGWAWRVAERVTHPAFWIDRDGQWVWRGMFEDIPLPVAWPVYVSHAEASAYARWAGRRLPTEAEYHRAAFGTPDGEERLLPWSATESLPLSNEPGNFDLQHWEPVPTGSRPQGASAWGIHDLAGNGWEWTASVFEPFPGFTPMPTYPEYSADFFDGQHYVLKGASPGTARELVRRSFRNWFRPNYPYVYAKFRTVSAEAR